MVKIDPEKILQAALLRPRRKDTEKARYGSFNRRMIAAGIDLLLVSALLAPVIDMTFDQVYGPATITYEQIAQAVEARGPATSAEAWHMFMQEMETSGFLARWGMNMRWHLLALCVFVTVFWHFWAATPGKMLCRLRVVDAKTEGPMGDWQSILRILGYFVSALVFGLGFMWMGLDKKRRGWHDMIAGTVVLADPLWKRKKKDEASAEDATA